MVTTLSQDLCKEAWSVSQARQHVCNVASCAPVPLRNPALCGLLQKWVSEYSLYCSLSIPRYLPPPSSPVLCGAMCSALALLVTALEQCLPSTHTHTQCGQALYWSRFSHANKAQVGPCAEKQKVLGTLCPTNLLTWLTGWWSHAGSICDVLVNQVLPG